MKKNTHWIIIIFVIFVVIVILYMTKGKNEVNEDAVTYESSASSEDTAMIVESDGEFSDDELNYEIDEPSKTITESSEATLPAGGVVGNVVGGSNTTELVDGDFGD